MRKSVYWPVALSLALLVITACENAGSAPGEAPRETPTITVFNAYGPNQRVEFNGTLRPGEVYRIFEMKPDGERVELGTLDPNNVYEAFGTDGPRLRNMARSPELLAEVKRLQEEGLSGLELLSRAQEELNANPSLGKIREELQKVQVRK